MTEAEQSENHIKLLEEILALSRQKEDYMQRVINNYGSHKVGDYLKKIEELEDKIKSKMEQRREFEGSRQN